MFLQSPPVLDIACILRQRGGFVTDISTKNLSISELATEQEL